MTTIIIIITNNPPTRSRLTVLSHYYRISGREVVPEAEVSMKNGATDNKHSPTALGECDRHVREMLDNVHLIAVMLDLSGNIIFCNNFLCELTGWNKEDLLGRNWFDTCLPETVKDTIKAYFLKSIKTGQITPHYENEIFTKSGGKRIIFWNNSVLRGDNGECMGTTSIGEDITLRVHVEKERAAMLHMLTHDIKGPLSVIYGYGEMSSKMSPDDSARIMADIQKAGRRIYSIIDDILSLSRLESDEPRLLIRPVSLPELVEQAVKENEAIASERSITITVENTGAPPRIYADPEQLGRAVGNLVANAVNYNKKGGSVRVMTGIVPEQANRVFIEVADDGDGIPDEDIPHIFEKYYRGKRSAKKRGTGLGLAIVKAAADAHGGKVELKSKAGEGSTFTITLPVKPGM